MSDQETIITVFGVLIFLIVLMLGYIIYKTRRPGTMGGRRLGSVADDVQMRSYVPIDSSVGTPCNQRIQKRVSMLDRNIKDTRI